MAILQVNVSKGMYFLYLTGGKHKACGPNPALHLVLSSPHLVSTRRQHRAPCPYLRSSYIYTVLRLQLALWRQLQDWCGPRWKWVWHPCSILRDCRGGGAGKTQLYLPVQSTVHFLCHHHTFPSGCSTTWQITTVPRTPLSALSSHSNIVGKNINKSSIHMTAPCPGLGIFWD